MGKKSHTQRTLAYFKQDGFKCDMVERWISNPKHPGGGFRKDCFGFMDILAIGGGGIVAVQSCGQDFKEHDRKITENSAIALNALEWLKCGGEIVLIGWRKVKVKRGGKALRWSPRIKKYEISDFILS